MMNVFLKFIFSRMQVSHNDCEKYVKLVMLMFEKRGILFKNVRFIEAFVFYVYREELMSKGVVKLGHFVDSLDDSVKLVCFHLKHGKNIDKKMIAFVKKTNISNEDYLFVENRRKRIW